MGIILTKVGILALNFDSFCYRSGDISERKCDRITSTYGLVLCVSEKRLCLIRKQDQNKIKSDRKTATRKTLFQSFCSQ